MEPSKEEILVKRLTEKKERIAFAESCTGGLAAARLINVPSASNVITESFITYSNEAKVKYLHVQPQTIQAHGVVSEEVAGEMAYGAAQTAQCEIGVGISGIAGPSGGTRDKPVGMVCFGFCINGLISTDTRRFGAVGRSEVRRMAVEFVYDRLLELTAEDNSTAPQ